MGEEVFRKKSLDKMKSPESLDDYIRVSNPGVWLLLACIILLLVGAVIWGAFGHIDSIVPVTVKVENGAAVCYVKEDNIVGVSVDMTVNFNGQDMKIAEIGQKEADGYACPLRGQTSLPNGFYKGNVVVQSVRPLSFVLN